MTPPTATARAVDLAGLVKVLLHGTPETRRRAAETLVADADADADADAWHVLACTVASDEGWLLRARCLEALGTAAGQAPRAAVEAILASLTPAPPSCAAGEVLSAEG